MSLTLLKNKLPWLLLIMFALFTPQMLMATGYTFLILVLCLAFLYIIAVSGLDIVFGYSGQISIGHAAFFAIGAYTSGILHNNLGIPVLVTMLVSAVAAAGIGALLAYPASKLVFHFLSLSTIAFGEIVFQIVANSPGEITGNFRGMFSGPVTLFGFALNTSLRFYYFGLACVIVFLVIKNFIVKSKIGRAFMAIRENTRAADGMGVDVRKYKVMAFSISAFYTGWAGAMYMHFVRYISPETFTIETSILFIIMLLFGGTASLLGPVVGVISVMMLTEVLRPLQEYNMLIFGVMMLLVILVIPGGIYGTLRDKFYQIVAKIKDKSKEKGGSANA